MPIRKGEPWGEPAPLPDDGVVVASDVAARRILVEARRSKRPFPTIGLLGGDLCRTLGGQGDAARLRSDEAMTFPVDLGEVLLDGRLHLFVAHLVARRRFWQGRAVVAMNAAWLGELNLGPKAHPDDGLLDISEGALSWRDRREARRRARTGAHLPHPGIEVRRTRAAQFDFDRPVPVRLDGELVGSFRSVSVRVEPDAFHVVV
jgi:diacylglycerol kinase family enzyme